LTYLPRWFEEYGELFRIRSPLGSAVMVGAPQLAQQVLVDRYSRYQKKSRAYNVLRILMGNGLVTSEGEFWRSQRKLLQPAFHRRRLEALCAMMVDRTTAVLKRLGAAAAAGQPLELVPLLSQLTLDIITRAMFSSDVQGAAAGVSHHIGVLNEYALRLLRQPWRFLLPHRIPTPFNSRQYRSFTALNAMVADILRERRRQPEAHDDLLSMLLSACADETGRGMSDAQLRDEVMTIFVAGHETTANSMAWLLHAVAGHPEVEQRMVAEIDALWPEGGLTPAHLPAFRYTQQVIEEVLRLYPTIWSVGRNCTETDDLGGYEIPVGMNLVVPIFHFHWSERFWSQPQQFDPDRFAPDRRPPPEPLIYFPFGAGPRSCIGNHFALQELMLMTLLFHRHFQFRPAGAAVIPDPLITLRPRGGLTMHVRPRTGLLKATHA